MSAEDRLSALPDGLLHAIMSFLLAPQAVQMSLLSRRWRHLWRSAPLIKIDSHDFGISGISSRDTMDERWARFEDFATNLLLFHDNISSLGAFRLRSRLHNMCHVDRWVRRGIEYCPSVLQIQILGFDHGFKLPVDMLIENSDKFPIFDNMRTLDLYGCFCNEYELNDKLEALRSFIKNAPCLEKLILQYCMYYSFSDSEWEPERKNITLHRHGNIFQCQKLKLIEVIYDYDHDHQLIELLWSLGRSLPDASIKLSKIELFP
ncbi:hypothetical protein U9M48_012255 [Paspalum notatum var. saurae]|uniref:F-box domain-containing protein n=1 Tax=Paspalum notatum var. saurae TaxID=547442 RepID=A0AAQ3SX82_PASNO